MFVPTLVWRPRPHRRFSNCNHSRVPHTWRRVLVTCGSWVPLTVFRWVMKHGDESAGRPAACDFKLRNIFMLFQSLDELTSPRRRTCVSRAVGTAGSCTLQHHGTTETHSTHFILTVCPRQAHSRPQLETERLCPLETLHPRFRNRLYSLKNTSAQREYFRTNSRKKQLLVLGTHKTTERSEVNKDMKIRPHRTETFSRRFPEVLQPRFFDC